MNAHTAADLAARLQMMILGATGASVRVSVSDRVLLIAATETDLDAAASFVGAQRGFTLAKREECRGTWRASFRPVAAA